MAIVLGANQYGKAEVRLVRLIRDTPRHQIQDLSVSTALRGDFAAAHLSGDQATSCPPTRRRTRSTRSPGSSRPARSRTSRSGWPGISPRRSRR